MTTLFYGALLVVGLALLAVAVVRALVGGLDGEPHRVEPQNRTEASRARQILDERYAAGELNTEEYQHRRRVLEERN